MKTMENICGILTVVFWIAFVLFDIWIVASFADVIAFQFSGGTESAWNLFRLITNSFGRV